MNKKRVLLDTNVWSRIGKDEIVLNHQKYTPVLVPIVAGEIAKWRDIEKFPLVVSRMLLPDVIRLGDVDDDPISKKPGHELYELLMSLKFAYAGLHAMAVLKQVCELDENGIFGNLLNVINMEDNVSNVDTILNTFEKQFNETRNDWVIFAENMRRHMIEDTTPRGEINKANVEDRYRFYINCLEKDGVFTLDKTHRDYVLERLTLYYLCQDNMLQEGTPKKIDPNTYFDICLVMYTTSPHVDLFVTEEKWLIDAGKISDLPIADSKEVDCA